MYQSLAGLSLARDPIPGKEATRWGPNQEEEKSLQRHRDVTMRLKIQSGLRPSPGMREGEGSRQLLCHAFAAIGLMSGLICSTPTVIGRE